MADTERITRIAQGVLVAVAVVAAAGAAWRYVESRETDPAFDEPEQRVAVTPESGPVGMRPFVRVRGFEQGTDVRVLFCPADADAADCAELGVASSPAELRAEPIPATVGETPVEPGTYELRAIAGDDEEAVGFTVVPFALGPRPTPRPYADVALRRLSVEPPQMLARGAPCRTQFMPDGRIAIDSTVLDPATGVSVELAVASAELAWSPDGERLAIVTEDSKEIRLAQPDGSEAVTVVREARGLISSVTWSPEGDRIAFVARSEPGVSGGPGAAAVSTFDLVTGERTSRGPGTAVAWSPTDDRLAVETAAGRIELVEDGERVELAEGRRPAWSPDGALVAFVRPEGEEAGAVRVRRVVDEAERELIEGGVCGVSFSADGRWLAVVRPEGEAGTLSLQRLRVPAQRDA